MKRGGLLTLCYNWNNVRGREFGYDLGISTSHFAMWYTLQCELNLGPFQSLRTGVTSPQKGAGNWGALSNEGQDKEDVSNFCSRLWNHSSKYRALFTNLEKCMYALLRSYSTLLGANRASLHALPGTTLSPSGRTEPSGTLSDFSGLYMCQNLETVAATRKIYIHINF